MKIRLKAFSVVGISSAIIILITLIVLKVLLLDYIERLEFGELESNYKRVATLLERERDSLKHTVLDWSCWDDTYEFIENKNSRYIAANLQNSTLDVLKLNFILCYGQDQKLVYGLSNIQETGTELDFILNNNGQSLFAECDREAIAGLYRIGSGIVFVSIAPVTTTDGLSPSKGYLIMGKYVDQNFINYMEQVLQGDLQIVSDIKAEKPLKQGTSAAKYGDKITWITKQERNITSYTQLDDIYGKKSLLLRQSMERGAYETGQATIKYFIAFFFATLFLMTVISIFIIDRLVTNPLKKFHNFMWKLGKTRDTSLRINVTGTDEIAELGYLTNNMLQKLDESYEELRLLKERFRLTLEATNDGYLDANLITNEVYISPGWLDHLGYKEINRAIDLNSCLKAIVFNEDRKKFANSLNKMKNKKADFLRLELRVTKKSGELLWVLARGKVVQYNEEGVPSRFVCAVSDITESKKYEEESIFLSQTDMVTGLKNRAYLEDLMNKTEKYTGEDTWIIMGDVNGLKLINDSTGHQEGDRLLKTIGTILKECCSKDDIPARWGGDEFVVYIRNKGEEYVQALIGRITEACERVKDCPIMVSITMGYSNRGSDLKPLNSVLKRAEEGMYRHKLLESRSTRSSIIASLEQTLHEKHIETLEHTKRIRRMCVKVGNRMGLSHEEMDELVLLGALHDIGKIGVPESILMKPDKLTAEEWVTMKKHSEIGYRIAAATPELAHIADEILYHHERYDGTGYPHGLSGKDIPKLARIISIVDSFDVMTNERVYKASMTADEAVQELRDCSGKQFDPEIVELFISSLKIVK